MSAQIPLSTFKRVCIVATFITIFILLVIQTLFFVSQEQPLYSWDYRRAWFMWSTLCMLFENLGIGALISIYDSIQTSEYNFVSVALLIPFNYSELNSRSAFILSIIICYNFPVTYLVYRTIDTLKISSRLLFKITVICITAVFPLFIAPSIRGYVDIVGLIPILLVTLITINSDLTLKIQPKKIITIGLLLYLSFLLRRWYAYSLIGLYASLPWLNYIIHTKTNFLFDKNRIYTVVLNFITAGICSIVILLLIQYENVLMILHANYQYQYSNYNLGIFAAISKLFDAVGLYIIPFFLLGTIRFTFTKNRKLKIWGIFCLFNLIIGFFLLSFVVTPYTHHLLPSGLWILFISFLGLETITSFFKERITYIFVNIICILSSFFIVIISFNKIDNREIANYPFLPEKTLPLAVNHISSYYTLAQEIKMLNNGVAILSSSLLFNDQIIDGLSNNSLIHLSYTPQVDLRDKLHLNIFRLPYLVVTDPVLTHLPAQHQSVIAIPAHNLLTQTNIGHAYQRLAQSYLLDSNIQAYIYRKERAFNLQEVKTFLHQFITRYPEWETLYNQPIADFYLTADLENQQDSINYTLNEQEKTAQVQLRISPQSTVQAEISPFSGSIQFNIMNPASSQLSITFQNPNHPPLHIFLTDDTSFAFYDSGASNSPSRIHIQNHSQDTLATLLLSYNLNYAQ